MRIPGTFEIILIILAIVLLFGAKKIPEIARGLGKGINEFKDAVETGKKEILDTKNGIESEEESGKIDQ